MGIQFNQVDNLQGTFDSVSGYLQGQVTPLTGDLYQVVSGDVTFAGTKTFTGNATFSGAQGVGIEGDSLYDKGYAFITSGLKIGDAISSVRINTPLPAGKLQVSGGYSYFDGNVYIRNDAGLSGATITGGTISGSTGYFNEISLSGNPVGTGTEYAATSGVALKGTTFITSGSGSFNLVKISGSPSGILQLHNLPYETQTGDLPTPSSGTVYRSGHYLMIV